MSEPTPTKSKSILGPFEKIVLVVAVVTLIYAAFKRGGYKVAEKTEEIQIIDNPHSDKSNKKTRTFKPQADSESVDAVLSEIANQFSKAGHRDGLKNEKRLKEMGLSEDEADYFEEVKNNHELDEAVQSARDWYNILKTSHQTYGKVKSMFESISESATEDQKVDEVLQDENKSQEVYYKMQDWFDIPADDVRAFAKKGKKALSEWAEFVEESKRKEKKNN